MIIIDIDFDIALNEARIRATTMIENGLYSRFHLSNAQRIDKALLGCLGEIAFEHYLKSKNIDYKLDETDFTIVNSDQYDFLINNKKIDIKVAKKSTSRPPTDGWTYGYPQEQNPSTKDFVIVGWIDFNRKEIGFYGWIKGIEVSKYAVVTHNTFAGYKYLTPNHEFRWGAMNKDFENLFTLIKG
jgi:hypothetical protein